MKYCAVCNDILKEKPRRPNRLYCGARCKQIAFLDRKEALGIPSAYQRHKERYRESARQEYIEILSNPALYQDYLERQREYSRRHRAKKRKAKQNELWKSTLKSQMQTM